MAFDLRPLARRLQQAQINFNCLCCGSNEMTYSDTRYALIELQTDDHLAIEFGMASGIHCGARVCKACGFVHLHALEPLGPHEGSL